MNYVNTQNMSVAQQSVFELVKSEITRSMLLGKHLGDEKYLLIFVKKEVSGCDFHIREATLRYSNG